MDRRRLHSWDAPLERPLSRQAGQVTVHSDGSRVTIKPDGLAKWEAAPQRRMAARRPPAPRVSPAPPAPTPRSAQRMTPAPPAPTRHATPPKGEVTRVFENVAADTVPTAARAVADAAIRQTLAAHGFSLDQVRLQWMQRLAPGATRLYDDEFYGPHNMAGKTRSDGHDGRTVTIILRHDLPLETIAETALHEAFHAVQYLHAPLGMRDTAISKQAEQQAQEFARSHLRDIQGLLRTLQPRRASRLASVPER